MSDPKNSPKEKFIDELTPIAEYIAKEMNVNSQSEAAQMMAEFNSFSLKKCIGDLEKKPLWKKFFNLKIGLDHCIEMGMTCYQVALLLWADKVRQNSDWDHKPKICKKFTPRVSRGKEQHWHLYGNILYYYDVWSNIHYGYAGKAAKFSDAVLLDGAGLEQIGSQIFRGKWPKKAPDTSGLKAWDDPHDRAGIKIGIRLWKISPGRVSVQQVLRSVIPSRQIRIKLHYTKKE